MLFSTPAMPDKNRPPPRVLHVIHGLWVGGAEIDLVRKLEWLHRHENYPIDVCCLMRRGQLSEALEATDANLIGPLMTHRRDPRGVISLRRLLIRRRWDIVHSHMYEGSLVTGLALSTLPPARWPRWIVSEHAMADYWKPMQLRWLGYMAQRAAAFVVPTERASQSFIDRGFPRDRLRVISNGVSWNAPSPSARDRVRESLGVSTKDFLIGTICRLHRVKALPILFEATATIPVKVVIAGDGPARLELEALLAARGWTNRIQLLGMRMDVPDLLASLDLFVLPSFSESMSIAVAEALLAGVPVVATRTGGIPEITGDGVYARLVPPGDVAALHQAIVATLADLPAARRSADKGRDWIREHLSVEGNARRLHELYAQVIDT